MTKIDQFESVFKAADKPAFELQSVGVERVLLVTDLLESGADAFLERIQLLTHVARDAHWTLVRGDEYTNVAELLAIVERTSPDLIVMYRNLRAPAREYPYSLGVYVDVLTQATHIPVLLAPHPTRLEDKELRRPECVMAVTDHLTGDNRLVSYAAMLTESGGRLLLTHVENEATFERYIGVIGKLPSIDTESAEIAIREQLLKEPRDFIESCRVVLQEAYSELKVESIVTLGRHLADYRRLIEEHDVDLLVLNTKDDDQLAMHGVAYPLTIELRDTSMLLL